MAEPSKTTVDWLRFRAQAEPVEALEAMRGLFGTLGPDLRLKPLQHGMLGFQQGAQIVVEDLVLGRMDYGGASQRGWVRVDLPGGGCEWVTCWGAAGEVESLPRAQLRRVDVALTTWHGEVTHERVCDAHAAGRFVLHRPPKLRRIESSERYDGRTCEIGRREKSDKFMRCYEKGWQLLRDLPPAMRSKVSSVMGFPPADIYRCEVEFKAVTMDIPWDITERPDHYFAGAYPFCADLLPEVEPDVFARRPERVAARELSIALENCKAQFGSVLFTALTAYGGDIGAVMEKIVGSSHSQRLLEAGVLLVDHE